MTRLIIETDDSWAREKIKFAIDTEIHLLKKQSKRLAGKYKIMKIPTGRLIGKNCTVK